MRAVALLVLVAILPACVHVHHTGLHAHSRADDVEACIDSWMDGIRMPLEERAKISDRCIALAEPLYADGATVREQALALFVIEMGKRATRSMRALSQWSRLEPVFALRDGLAPLDRPTLHALFRATALIAGEYAATEKNAGALGRVYLALGADVTPTESQQYIGLLVRFRGFDEAKAIVAAHPDAHAQRLPDRIEGAETPGVPSVFEVSEDGRVLRRVAVSLDEPHLVVVLAPWCHFVQGFLRFVEKSDETRRFFEQHGMLLLPQNELDLDEVAAWNREHPRTPMRIVDRESDWKPITEWNAFPTFYAVAHVERVDSFDGWESDEKSGPKLMHAIRALEAPH